MMNQVCVYVVIIQIVFFHHSLEGWWTDIIIKQLSKQLNRPILYQELQAKIYDLQKQFNDDDLPIDFINAIVPSEEDLSEEQKIFIEQLRLVCLSDPRIKQAISDYHKAYEQRSKWIREELVMIDELEKYDNKLINEWSEYFNSMKEELGQNPDERQYIECGRKLYNKISFIGRTIRIRVSTSNKHLFRELISQLVPIVFLNQTMIRYL